MADYTWLGNLDIHSYVNTQLTSESNNLGVMVQNQIAPLQAVQTTLNAQLANYTSVDKLLTKLSDAITALNTVFNPKPQISTSNPNIVTATQIIGQTVSTGAHTLNVTSLAQASTFASAVQTSATTILNSSDVISLSGGGGTSFQITADPATDTLQTLATKINAQAATNHMGVHASVIQSSNGQYQLVVNATQTGQANAVSVTDDSTGSSTPLGIASTQTAANAIFTFDGVAMQQASNSNISISGLNVNLLGTGSASVTVNNSSPTSDVIAATQDVVDDYNDLMTELSKDQTTQASDPALANIQRALQDIFESQSMYDIGISSKDITKVPKMSLTLANGDTGIFTPSGIITLDKDKLTAKLADNLSSVQTFLTDITTGALTKVNQMLSAGGTVYKTLHDATFGAEVTTQSHVNDIGKQISQIQSDYADQKKALKMQFAALEATLAAMQMQSQTLSQQIDALGK